MGAGRWKQQSFPFTPGVQINSASTKHIHKLKLLSLIWLYSIDVVILKNLLAHMMNYVKIGRDDSRNGRELSVYFLGSKSSDTNSWSVE